MKSSLNWLTFITKSSTDEKLDIKAEAAMKIISRSQTRDNFTAVRYAGGSSHSSPSSYHPHWPLVCWKDPTQQHRSVLKMAVHNVEARGISDSVTNPALNHHLLTSAIWDVSGSKKGTVLRLVWFSAAACHCSSVCRFMVTFSLQWSSC